MSNTAFPGFVSTIFLVQKKDGGTRPIINLRELNQHLVYEHFKMEGIHLLQDLLIRNDFLVKIDLKDAYLTVPIWENHRKFLRFQWGHETLEFSSLPFGVSVAPRIFTKLMKTPMGLLRRLGCRLIVYLDDILLMNQSAEGLKKDQDLTIHILTSLGFIINYKKSVLDPSHCQEFLGFRVNSQEMTLSLPQHKIKDIKNICQKCLNQTVVSVRQISEVIGKLSASARAIFPAPLHYRFLQMLKTKGLTPLQNYESVVTLDSESKAELLWWIENIERWNGRTITPPSPEYTIESDASDLGWGAVCQGVRIGGPWLGPETSLHINAKELLAVFLAVKSFLREKENTHVLIKTDNTTTVAHIKKLGGTVSKQCVYITRDLWQWCLDRKIFLQAEFLPGVENEVADWESRHMRDKSSWMLDRNIFLLINATFGPLNVDLFADRTNNQLDVYMSWFPDPGAVATNAFLHPWMGENAYAFPPFCLIGQCIAKLRAEKCEIVLVTPGWQTQAWYPHLMSMSIQNPLLLPTTDNLLTSPIEGVHPLVSNGTLTLIAWKLSGDVSKQLAFQKTLKTFYLDHAEMVRTGLTKVPGTNGSAGVVNGKLLPFQHPCHNF